MYFDFEAFSLACFMDAYFSGLRVFLFGFYLTCAFFYSQQKKVITLNNRYGGLAG